MNFRSLPHLLDHFKDEQTCIEYYEQVRWPNGIICPKCNQHVNPYRTKRGYRCRHKACGKKFTVRVGTIFENSKLPLRTWFAAIYLCSNHKKGISSVQLALDLHVGQNTAWFMLHRIREMYIKQSPCSLNAESVIEIDESYCGGRDKNKHRKKKQSADNPDLARDGSKYNKKKVVVGAIERKGRVVLKHIPQATLENAVPFIMKYVPQGSTLFTDESPLYDHAHEVYKHNTVNHSRGEYKHGNVHTNTIENFWSTLKRTLYGTYHQVSHKHFDRYLQEASARFNTRELKIHERFHMFLADSNAPMPYKRLIAR